jgi:large subunit ribosomal protein L21
MFAVIKTGGKQYRVSEGSIVRTEKIEAPEGGVIDLNTVLMISDGADIKIGSPFLSGARVTAEILEQKRDKKVLVFKKIRRHNYRRKNGHRQNLSILKIKEIVLAVKE